MANQQEISSEELYGISKKFNRELEALPLHSHGAIVDMVKTGFDHRNKQLQFAHMTAQQDQQERIIRLKEYEMEQARKAEDRTIPISPGPN